MYAWNAWSISSILICNVTCEGQSDIETLTSIRHNKNLWCILIVINRLRGYKIGFIKGGGSKRGNSKLKRVVCKELTTNWRKYFKLSANSNAVNIKVCLNAGRGRQIKVGNSNKQSKLGGRTFVFTHTCIFATYTLQYTLDELHVKKISAKSLEV